MFSGHHFSVNLFNRRYTINAAYLLGLVILLGAVLRFYKLDYQSLWLDEIHSLFGSNPDTTVSEVINYSKNDQPPAYFLLLYFWLKIFSYNEFYARLLSAMIGVLGIPAIYLLGKELKNEKIGLLAASLTAINYFHIYYSQEVRFYTLLFFASTLSYLFYIKCIKEPKVFNYVAYILFTTLCIYTHYFGLVVAASQAILFGLVIYLNKPDKKFIIHSIGSAAIILVLISPWIPQFFSDSQISSFWISAERFPRFLVAYLYDYTRDKLSFFIYQLLIIYFIFLIITNWKKERPSMQIYVLLGWIVLGFGIPYFYSVLKMPILISRYTIFILPAILVIIALSLDSISNRYLRIGLPIIIVLSSLRSLVFIQDYYEKLYKQQIKEVAQAVVKDNDENYPMVSGHAWHYNFYFDYLQYEGKAVHHWEPDVPEKISNSEAFWILQVNTTPEAWEKKLTKSNFYLAKEIKFHASRASLYRKKNLLTQSRK